MKIRADGKTISAETYQALRDSILFGRIAPGTRVTTNDLCRRFGASLGAVREALSHLRAEGLVTAESHRGYTVTPVSEEDLLDLTQVRVEIEALCLRRSIQNGTLEWESSLVAAAHVLNHTYIEHHPDGTPNPIFESAHDAFHLALVSACQSPRLLGVRARLFDQSERYRRLDASLESDNKRDSAEEHRLIMQAALARDEHKAVHYLVDHIARTTDEVIRALRQKKKLARKITRKVTVARKARRS